jgi:hypothetical protein
VIHDWTVLIMWVTSVGVTAWGQKWKAKAERLQDALQYIVEEQADEDVAEDAMEEERRPGDQL